MPTVLITGANRGLGLEFARQYAAGGWRVIATCRNPDNAAELAALDGRVEILPLDVNDLSAIDRLADELSGQPIDLLLLNAGVNPQREAPPAAGIDYDAWEEAFRINTMAPTRMAVAFEDHVRRSDRKIIAAVTSGNGSIVRNPGRNYVYRSSKAALNLCMRGLSVELGGGGLIVVMLAPGRVRTDMGGMDAERLPGPVIEQVRGIIDGLGEADSGRFIHYDGTDIPW